MALTTKTIVLVIDDDVGLAGRIKDWLEKYDFEVVVAHDGAAGLRQLYRIHPALVILDVAMPRTDGWEVCRRIRELDDLPIILLTARDDIAGRIRGFDLGADDYVPKPFELPELLARVRAVLRRFRAFRSDDQVDRVFRQGDLVVDLAAHRVTLAGRPVELSPTEFRLLAFLVQNRGRVVSHGEILSNVWGPDYRNQLAYVKLYIRYLREKIELEPSKPQIITTERGFGYRFAGPPPEQAPSCAGPGPERAGGGRYRSR